MNNVTVESNVVLLNCTEEHKMGSLPYEEKKNDMPFYLADYRQPTLGVITVCAVAP